MSWSNIQKKRGGDATGSLFNPVTLSFAAAVTAGSKVSGALMWENDFPGPTLTNITDDKGNPYITLDPISDVGNGEGFVSFYATSFPNGLPTSIIANFSGTTASWEMSIKEDSPGAGFTISLDGHTGQIQSVGAGVAGTNVFSSGSITTTANGDLVDGFFIKSGGSPTLTAGTSPNAFTVRENADPTSSLSEDFVQTSSGSIAATFGQSNGTTVGTVIGGVFMLPFKAVAAGVTPIVVGQTSPRIFVPGKGPDRGLRSPKAFPSSSAVLTLSATQGTYTLTGQAQTLAVGMPASQGTYSLTGQAQTLGVGMPAGQGTYSLTGFAATLSVVPNPVGRTTPRIFRPDSGPHLNLNRPKAFPTTGGPVTFTLAAGQGTYTLNGVSQTLLRGIQIAAGQGTYTLTGKPQTLNRTIQINAGQGTYTLTGKPQSFAFTMPATQGTYALTGQAQTLAVGMPAGQGTYALTGKPQSFAVALSLLAGQGTYSLNGIGQVMTFTPAGGASNPPHSNPFFATPGSLTSLP